MADIISPIARKDIRNAGSCALPSGSGMILMVSAYSYGEYDVGYIGQADLRVGENQMVMNKDNA
jgi:hypothetical protein